MTTRRVQEQVATMTLGEREAAAALILLSSAREKAKIEIAIHNRTVSRDQQKLEEIQVNQRKREDDTHAARLEFFGICNTETQAYLNGYQSYPQMMRVRQNATLIFRYKIAGVEEFYRLTLQEIEDEFRERETDETRHFELQLQSIKDEKAAALRTLGVGEEEADQNPH